MMQISHAFLSAVLACCLDTTVAFVLVEDPLSFPPRSFATHNLVAPIAVATTRHSTAESASAVRLFSKKASFSKPSVPSFCADCGKPDMVAFVPEGDERLRACCPHCGRIEYSNPKIVVSCVVRVEGRGVLMGQRAIEPRQGTWGIPQGYMEHGETSRQAAVREVWEETGVILDPASLTLRAVYNVPGSVQLVYATYVQDYDAVVAVEQQVKAYNAHSRHTDGGKESLDVALFSPVEVAEKEICFPTVHWALEHCQSGSNHIQQMTKFYDSEKDEWTLYEDEASKA